MNLQRMFLVALTISTLTQAHIEPRAVLKTAAALKTKLHLLKAEGDIHWLVKKYIARLECPKSQAAAIARNCRAFIAAKPNESPRFEFISQNAEEVKALTRSLIVSACEMLSDAKVMHTVISNVKNAAKFVRRCKAETVKRNPAVKAELSADAQFFNQAITVIEARQEKLCALFKAKAEELRANFTGTNESFLEAAANIVEELFVILPEIKSDKWEHYFQMADPCAKCQAQFNELGELAKQFYVAIAKTAEKAFAKKAK